MPANLTPEYHRAEQQYRAAKSPEEKLAALEEMLRVVPKHKGTDGLQADLKARIAKLRKLPPAKAGRSGFSHMVAREGAGQVALIGPPNSGKSSLVAALTHARPEVADYPFTTREAIPGMMPFEEVAIQLVDLPPVSLEHTEPWLFDCARRADLLWLVVDGRWILEGLDLVLHIVRGRHVGPYPAGETPALPRAATRTKAGVPAGAEPEASDDPARVPKPSLLVATGVDRPGVDGNLEAAADLLDRRWPMIGVSAASGAGIDLLKRRTFEGLHIVRVFTKQPGKPADTASPFTLARGSTVADLASRIHKDVSVQMKYARIWGTATFDGQTVQREHVLADRDVVEIHT